MGREAVPEAHEAVALPKAAKLRLEELLAELGALEEITAAKSDRTMVITVGDLVDKAQHAGFGFLTAVLALVAIPFVGLSTPFGLLIALLGAQMLIGRQKPWLPNRARKRALAISTLDRVATMLARRTRWMARLTRRRWTGALRGPAWHLVGLGVTLLALGLALPLPIPGSNIVFLAPIFVYAIGLLEQDGVCIALGHCGVLVNGGLAVLFGKTVLGVLHALLGWVSC